MVSRLVEAVPLSSCAALASGAASADASRSSRRRLRHPRPALLALIVAASAFAPTTLATSAAVAEGATDGTPPARLRGFAAGVRAEADQAGRDSTARASDASATSSRSLSGFEIGPDDTVIRGEVKVKVTFADDFIVDSATADAAKRCLARIAGLAEERIQVQLGLAANQEMPEGGAGAQIGGLRPEKNVRISFDIVVGSEGAAATAEAMRAKNKNIDWVERVFQKELNDVWQADHDRRAYHVEVNKIEVVSVNAPNKANSATDGEAEATQGDQFLETLLKPQVLGGIGIGLALVVVMCFAVLLWNRASGKDAEEFVDEEAESSEESEGQSEEDVEDIKKAAIGPPKRLSQYEVRDDGALDAKGKNTDITDETQSDDEDEDDPEMLPKHLSLKGSDEELSTIQEERSPSGSLALASAATAAFPPRGRRRISEGKLSNGEAKAEEEPSRPRKRNSQIGQDDPATIGEDLVKLTRRLSDETRRRSFESAEIVLKIAEQAKAEYNSPTTKSPPVEFGWRRLSSAAQDPSAASAAALAAASAASPPSAAAPAASAAAAAAGPQSSGETPKKRAPPPPPLDDTVADAPAVEAQGTLLHAAAPEVAPEEAPAKVGRTAQEADESDEGDEEPSMAATSTMVDWDDKPQKKTGAPAKTGEKARCAAAADAGPAGAPSAEQPPPPPPQAVPAAAALASEAKAAKGAAREALDAAAGASDKVECSMPTKDKEEASTEDERPCASEFTACDTSEPPSEDSAPSRSRATPDAAAAGTGDSAAAVAGDSALAPPPRAEAKVDESAGAKDAD